MDATEISALRLALADARAQAEAAGKLVARLEHLLRTTEAAGAPSNAALKRPDGRLTEAGVAALYAAMDDGDTDAKIAEAFKMAPGAVAYRRRRWEERTNIVGIDIIEDDTDDVDEADDEDQEDDTDREITGPVSRNETAHETEDAATAQGQVQLQADPSTSDAGRAVSKSKKISKKKKPFFKYRLHHDTILERDLAGSSPEETAKILGCSRAHVYKVLKETIDDYYLQNKVWAFTQMGQSEEEVEKILDLQAGQTREILERKEKLGKWKPRSSRTHS